MTQQERLKKIFEENAIPYTDDNGKLEPCFNDEIFIQVASELLEEREKLFGPIKHNGDDEAYKERVKIHGVPKLKDVLGLIEAVKDCGHKSVYLAKTEYNSIIINQLEVRGYTIKAAKGKESDTDFTGIIMGW